MKYKVFVDGQAGTTGLKINDRLSKRTDIEVLKIDGEKRKDIETRGKFLNEADIVFLCLPDSASKESVSLINNPKTRVLDTSTAFRTDDNWTYGLPELNKSQRKAIESSNRVAVPGCHATGFNLALYPLVQKGIVPKDYPITSQSITGYSGGGKKLIEDYEVTNLTNPKYRSPQLYALGLTHKHLPEMQKVNDLLFPPLFTPILGNFYEGMIVVIPLLTRLLNKKVTAKEVHEIMASHYEAEHFVNVVPFDSSSYLNNGLFDAIGCNNTNRAEIFVFGHDEQILVATRLDNLGKGASGAAVQNMNIMLGLDERTGLE